MKEAILQAPGKFILNEVEKPKISPDEVLIKVESCGICGSELDPFVGKSNGSYPAKLGHEVSGVVQEVGSKITRYKVGDLVTGRVSAGFAEYTKAVERNILPVPVGMSFDEAAMAEPIACVISAVKRINVKPGDTLVVIGCGFMGLLLMQCLSQKLPERLVAVDVREETFELAKKCGADLCLSPLKDDVKAKIDALTDGQGADWVVEVTGGNKGLDLAGELVRIRGNIAIFGYHQGVRQINMQQWNWKGIDIVNAHERSDAVYMSSMTAGVGLAARKKVTFNGLITHVFPLAKIEEAFRVASEKREGCVKAVIHP